jgi:hypothetical protein
LLETGWDEGCRSISTSLYDDYNANAMNDHLNKQLMIGNLMAFHLEQLADELDKTEGETPFRRERSLSNLWENNYREWWNHEGRHQQISLKEHRKTRRQESKQ